MFLGNYIFILNIMYIFVLSHIGSNNIVLKCFINDKNPCNNVSENAEPDA